MEMVNMKQKLLIGSLILIMLTSYVFAHTITESVQIIDFNEPEVVQVNPNVVQAESEDKVFQAEISIGEGINVRG